MQIKFILHKNPKIGSLFCFILQIIGVNQLAEVPKTIEKDVNKVNLF
jgi:hypothetical protein